MNEKKLRKYFTENRVLAMVLIVPGIVILAVGLIWFMIVATLYSIRYAVYSSSLIIPGFVWVFAYFSIHPGSKDAKTYTEGIMNARLEAIEAQLRSDTEKKTANSVAAFRAADKDRESYPLVLATKQYRVTDGALFRKGADESVVASAGVVNALCMDRVAKRIIVYRSDIDFLTSEMKDDSVKAPYSELCDYSAKKITHDTVSSGFTQVILTLNFTQRAIRLLLPDDMETEDFISQFKRELELAGK